MAAGKKVKYSIELDFTTENAEKSVKAATSQIKDQLQSIANESNKTQYFEGLVKTIRDVDKQLTQFKTKHGQDFDSVFKGVGQGAKQEFETVFKYAKSEIDKFHEEIKDQQSELSNLQQIKKDYTKYSKSAKAAKNINEDSDGSEISGFGKQGSVMNTTQVKNMYDLFDELVEKKTQFEKRGDTSSQEYLKNYVQILQTASGLIKANSQALDGMTDFEDVIDLEGLETKANKAKVILEALNIDELGRSIQDKITSVTQNVKDKIKSYADEMPNLIKELFGNEGQDNTGNNTQADNIEQNADATIKVIDIAKKKIVEKWKDYYHAIEEAKKAGVDVEGGNSSAQMDSISDSISDMLEQWGAKATKGEYKADVAYALSLAEDLTYGDIDINDIENKVNRLFQENGITIDIPLEKISIDVAKTGAEAQESAQEMTSGLEKVEVKTNDVGTAFQKLINYISQSGQSPQAFFNALITGAQGFDNELKDVLQSLNLIDSNGKAKFTTSTNGFSNNGTMISDDYALIAREDKKLPFSLDAKQKTAEAKALGANIGAVLEVYEDKANHMIYELQNKVSGKGILDFGKQIVNTEFLNATDEQVQKLIQDLLILQKTGLYVDWNGNNILYDKDNGFSFIDFFTKSVSGLTAGENNTVQENLKMFFDTVFQKFNLDTSDSLDVAAFKTKVDTLVPQIIAQNNAQQNATQTSKEAQAAAEATSASTQQEKSTHEQNTAAINTENQALQAQIELKKKAQSTTWKGFALDESLSDLKNKSGLQTLGDMEIFWKQANYDKQIDYKELDPKDVEAILAKDPEFVQACTDWYGLDQDFNAKNKLENMILADDDLRNAAMNREHQLYNKYLKKQYKEPISFKDFLNKEIEVYRGESSPKLFNEGQKLTFSFDRDVALNTFAYGDPDAVKSTKIIPTETIGSAAPDWTQHEYEVFVPSSKLPYIHDTDQSFTEYFNGLDEKTQKDLNSALIHLEKQRVENLLGNELVQLANQAEQSGSFNDNILNKFKQEVVPESLDVIGDYNTDDFAMAYNNMSEMQKKMVAFYMSLKSQPLNLSNDQFSNLVEWGNLGNIDLPSAIMGDKSGLQQHISQLTGESKFNIYGQNAQIIQEEAAAHQQNTQAIQQEQQAQQALNNTKTTYEDIVPQFTDLAFTSEGQKLKDVNNLWNNVASVEISKQSYPGHIENGEYFSKETGEVLDYSSLVQMVEDFEQAYGENFTNVKEYLSQAFAGYLSNAENISSVVKEAATDDELILDGFESDKRDSSDSLANTEQELQTQQQITAEKQKQAVLDQEDNQVDNVDTNQIQNVQTEIDTLDQLRLKIQEVEQAIANKTAAFENEGAVVGQVVQQEINALNNLIEALNNVKNIKQEMSDSDDVSSPDKILQDNQENTHGEIIADNNSVNITQPVGDYALDATLLATNGILNQILSAIGNGESFVQLIEPLNVAVAELKNVANGIVEHQQIQKSELSDASLRIANNYPELVSQVSAATTKFGSDMQIKQMKPLVDGVVQVEGAVKNAQGIWQGFVVSINDSNQVIFDAVGKQTKFAEALNKTASAAQDAQSKTPGDKSFATDLAAQTKTFNDYYDNLKDATYITDDLKDKLDDLNTSIHQITDTADLDAWKNELADVRQEITLAANTFTEQQKGKVDSEKQKLDATFNTLDFKKTDQDLTAEQQNLINGYMQAKAVLEAYKKSAAQGNQIELSTLQNITNTLYQQIDAYKQKNNIINGQKKAYGTNVVDTATGKYRSLTQRASASEFDNSDVIKQALSSYTESYQRLVNLQSQFKPGQDLTADQRAGFKQAQIECNKYAQDLNKLMNATQKFAESAENVQPLNEDFDDTKESSRMQALQDYVQTMYGASAEIGEFKNKFNELTFTVDNGNGTFTQMVAAINPARNAIGAITGDAKKATSAFGEFIGELKGKFKSIGAYLASSFTIQGAWQQIKQGVSYVKEIDTALTELKKVTDETDASYSKFLQTMSQSAGIVGSTTSELTQSAADWARLGYSMEEAGELAKNTAILMNVSEFDNVNEATEAMISSLQAFGYEASNSLDIVDKLNIVGKIIAQIV